MTEPNAIRYLSRGAVERCLPGAGAIADRTEALLAARRAGAAWDAPKASLHPGEGRLFLILGSGAADPALTATKTLGVVPGNAARGLAHISGLLVVHDLETGLPLAVLDAEHITGVRTAALSVIAARRLAHAGSRTIGFVGCGVQALSHLDALAAELPLEQVVAFSRRRESAEQVAARAEALGLTARFTDDADDLLETADVVVSTIPDQPGLEPFLDARRLGPGAFVSAVDLGRSWVAESLPAFDRIVVDDLTGHEPPVVNAALVDSDLAGLAGESRRAERNLRTGFFFRGVAFGDLAAASLCLEAAQARGEGVMLER